MNDLQRAVLGARARTGDDRIGAAVERGAWKVVRVTPKRRGCDVEVLAGGLTMAGAVAYLDKLGEAQS